MIHKLFCCRKLITGFTTALVLATVGWPAGPAGAKECAEIAKDKIAETLKKVNVPEVEVVGSRKSPLEGICEIEFNSKGAPGILYADPDLNYLVSGNLFDLRSAVNLTAASVQRLKDQKRVDLAKIALNDGLIVGEKGAAKKVIILTDPD